MTLSITTLIPRKISKNPSMNARNGKKHTTLEWRRPKPKLPYKQLKILSKKPIECFPKPQKLSWNVPVQKKKDNSNEMCKLQKMK
eukprot:5597314-Ditylum_brightwellii.AAC.1